MRRQKFGESLQLGLGDLGIADPGEDRILSPAGGKKETEEK